VIEQIKQMSPEEKAQMRANLEAKLPIKKS
jgi:hypothetical protein